MSDSSNSVPSDSFDTAAPEPVKAASRWEDFVDIFYAPSSVFRRRIGSGFGVPMLVVTILIGVIAIANSGVMQPMIDAEFTRNMAVAAKKNPQLTPAMIEKSRAFAGTIAKVATFFMIPVMIFLTGLVLWLVGKLVDAKETLATALMVTAYAFVPRVLEAVLMGVQGLLLDPASFTGRYKLTLGAGRFLDPDTASPLLLAIVGRLDVFTIWVTVLLAIGLAVTGRIPRGKAVIAGVLLWIIGALPGVLGALRAM